MQLDLFELYSLHLEDALLVLVKARAIFFTRSIAPLLENKFSLGLNNFREHLTYN